MTTSTTSERGTRTVTMELAVASPRKVAKVERKGRTVAGLHEVIRWLTGHGEDDLRRRS